MKKLIQILFTTLGIAGVGGLYGNDSITVENLSNDRVSFAVWTQEGVGKSLQLFGWPYTLERRAQNRQVERPTGFKWKLPGYKIMIAFTKEDNNNTGKQRIQAAAMNPDSYLLHDQDALFSVEKGDKFIIYPTSKKGTPAFKGSELRGAADSKKIRQELGEE